MRACWLPTALLGADRVCALIEIATPGTVNDLSSNPETIIEGVYNGDLDEIVNVVNDTDATVVTRNIMARSLPKGVDVVIRNNLREPYYVYIWGRNSDDKIAVVEKNGVVLLPSSAQNPIPTSIDVSAITAEACSEVEYTIPQLSQGRIYMSNRPLQFFVSYNGKNVVHYPDPGNTRDPNANALYTFVAFNQNTNRHLDATVHYLDDHSFSLPVEVRLISGSASESIGYGVRNKCLKKLCELAQQPNSGITCTKSEDRGRRNLRAKPGDLNSPIFRRECKRREAPDDIPIGMGGVNAQDPDRLIIDIGEHRRRRCSLNN